MVPAVGTGVEVLAEGDEAGAAEEVLFGIDTESRCVAGAEVGVDAGAEVGVDAGAEVGLDAGA